MQPKWELDGYIHYCNLLHQPSIILQSPVNTNNILMMYLAKLTHQTHGAQRTLLSPQETQRENNRAE